MRTHEPIPEAVTAGRSRWARAVCVASGPVLVVAVVTILSFAGCGAPGTVQGSVAGTSSPSPTAACPRIDEMSDGQRNCAVYDPDVAMAQNEGYRQQRTISPETRAELESFVGPVRRALTSLRPPVTVADVETALGPAVVGEQGMRTDDVGRGIRFGVEMEGGCVTGFVSQDGAVSVSTGGAIMDGGCLAMRGH